MTLISESIRDKLTRAFAPTRLEVVDDSARHAGHAGAREGGQSHFNVLIEAEVFAGVSRVARQRQIHAALAQELAGQIHALSVKALAPGERG
ncbi:MAG: BolA family protein [Caulobacter sp.]|nr:BolA family protein [Caulobacter sp.]